MKKLIIGDIFAIQLNNGKFAYGQYIYYDNYRPMGISEYTGHGCMVRIFDLMADEIVDVSEVMDKKEMSPPVFTGLTGAISKKRWKKIGHSLIKDFQYPKFRRTFGIKPGKYDDWKIWDGIEMKFIGELPQEYRTLEILCVWGYENLEQRIETGKSGHEGLI